MPNNSKIVVLIADDEPSTVAMLSSHLGSQGYSVLEASDGDEAWEQAHEHLPDLVLLDVMMPGMSGWEVCRKIREAVSLAHTGVVMLTGIGPSLNEMTSPLYGADAYVDKPFEFADLDRKIKQTLDRRRRGALGRADRGSEDSANFQMDDDELPTIPPPARAMVKAPLAKTKPHSPAKPPAAVKKAPAAVKKAPAAVKKAPAAVKKAPAPVKKAPAPVKKAPAKKAPAPVKKAPVKKAPVKKAPVKKAPAKKAPVKKAPVKKAPAKKSPGKKAPVKKAPVKKAPVKKAPVKKAPVKKAPAKKAPAKKAPAKKKR